MINTNKLQITLYGGLLALVILTGWIWPQWAKSKPGGILDVALAGNKDLLYFATGAPDNLYVYSPGLHDDRLILPGSERLSDVTISPDGTTVWTATKSGYIDRYEFPTDAETITTSHADHQRIAPVLSYIALSSNGRFLAVGYGNSEDYNSRDIRILPSDAENLTDVQADFSVSGDIQDIVANPARGLFYIINSHSDRVRIYNVDRFRLESDIIELGNSPGNFVVHPDGEKGYGAMNARNQVTPIDLIDNVVTDPIPLGFPPYAMAFNESGSRLYVASRDSAIVAIIDTETDTEYTRFELPPRMEGVIENNYSEMIAVSTNEQYLYVLPKRQELVVYDISDVNEPGHVADLKPEMVQSRVLATTPFFMDIVRHVDVPGID